MNRIIMLALTVSFICTSQVAAAMMTTDGGGSSAAVDEARKLVEDKQYAEAIAKLNTALKDDPQNAEAWNLLGFSSRMNGDFDASEKYYVNALKLEPEHRGALNYMGQLFVQTGRMEKARDVLARLEKACAGECKEFDQLAQAIKDGKAGNY